MSIRTITIQDHEQESETHNLYDVRFFDTATIRVTVTNTPSVVDEWISELKRVNPRRPLLVGLDVEWRPNRHRSHDNPIATIQLCGGPTCLIFQVLRSPTSSVPESLANFLKDEESVVAVGVGIEGDVEKLIMDYGVSVGRRVDLRGAAAEAYGRRELRNAGLKQMTRVVLGKEIAKPKRVTMSRWDNLYLTPPQVRYACVDAFVSYEIARILNVT